MTPEERSVPLSPSQDGITTPEPSAPHRPGTDPWEWLLLALAVAAYVWWMLLPLASVRHDNDFKHIYLGARALAQGMNPYPAESLLEVANRSGMKGTSINPYVYLPFTGQILAPLVRLPVHQASLVWFWVNQGLLGLTVLMTVLCLPRRCRPVLAAAVMVALLSRFHPLQRTLSAGQLTLVLTAATGLAAFLLQYGTKASLLLSGVVSALAMLFKLTPGLLVLPLTLLGGIWALMGFLIATAAGWAWSIWQSGWATQMEFLPMLKSMGHGKSSWQEHGATFWKDEANQSFNSLLTHLLVADNGKASPWLDGPTWLANGLSQALALAFLLWLFWAIWNQRKSLQDNNDPARLTRADITILAVHQTTLIALLVPALLWDHYAVAAVPAAIWLGAQSAARKQWHTFRTVALCAVLLALPWNPGSPSFRSGLGILLMSAKLWPLLILTWLAMTYNHQTSGGTAQASASESGCHPPDSPPKLDA